ncbi:MAG: hypothetical protein ACOY94_25900 [Bacillota bacterium]
MQYPVRLSRIERRRARETAAALRPPRPLWRLFGTLPLLALALLLLVNTTLAWFTAQTSLGDSTMTSGTFATLMDLSTTEISVSGLLGDSYTESFTVTSKAKVPLPIKAVWQGTVWGPNVQLSASTINPPGSPDNVVTITLSGAYSDFSGTLLVWIGSHEYDWGPLAVQVTGITYKIEELISAEVGVPRCTGTAAPWFDHNPVLKLTRVPGALAPQIDFTLSQSPAPPDADQVYLYDGRPRNGGQIIASMPPSQTSVDLYLGVDDVLHYSPIDVTITLSSPPVWVNGSLSYTFTMQHCGDDSNGDQGPGGGDGGGNAGGHN